MLLLFETGTQEARRVAQRIHTALAGTPAGLPAEHKGLTSWRGPDDTLDAMLARADQALYQAKTQGRNQTCIG